ncbi:MAG: sensor histidine kinase, partial [Oricola sp.]|nr:sensor histidine kinase [Oricola sp.]
DEAVLVLASFPDDEAALCAMAAAEGEAAKPVPAQDFESALAGGAGCLIMTEGALRPAILDPRLHWAAGQPAWSALPLLIITRSAGRLPHPIAGRHPVGVQVTLLHRPSTPEVMRLAIRQAMDARRRQYLIRDQMEKLEASHKQVLLLGREVQHRAKNSLAKVSSILRHTWRTAKSPEQFIENLERRIEATARGLDLMTETDWKGAKLAHLFAVEARAVFGKSFGDRFACDGEDIALNAEAALALHLVAHELTTNAVKYGAFSTRAGRVTVRWRRTGEGENEKLEFVWEETGGPAVARPRARGFGSQVVEQALAMQLGGYVQMNFRPEGLRCRMIMPLAEILSDATP